MFPAYSTNSYYSSDSSKLYYWLVRLSYYSSDSSKLYYWLVRLSIPLLGSRRSNQHENRSPHRKRQLRPCIRHGGQAWVIGQQAGSILGSSQGTD
jgi:hypothetical protein